MSTPPPIPKAGSLRRWGLVILLLSPVLVLLLGFMVFRVSNWSAIHRLEGRVRQRGEPLTLAQLQAAYPPITDAENAAIPLLQLWEREEPVYWKAFRSGKSPLPERKSRLYPPQLPFAGAEAKHIERRGPLPEGNRRAAEDFLSTNREHLRAVRAALGRPQCRFPEKIFDGFGMLLPHLRAIKAESTQFRVEGLMAAEAGDSEGSLAASRDSIRMGQLLATDPTLIGHLVRMACIHMGMDGLSQLLSRRALAPDQLSVMQSLLEQSEITNSWRQSLLTERPMQLSVFDLTWEQASRLDSSDDSDSDGTGKDATGFQIGMGFLWAIGMIDADRRLMLETFEKAIDLSADPSPEALAETRELFAGIKARASRPVPRLFSGSLLPSLSRAADRFAHFEGIRRSGLVAIAVERYRIDNHGALPESLESLVPRFLPAVPQDPCRSAPLLYRRLPVGYVVYSVGRDGRDDQGMEEGRRKLAGVDATFTVER